MNYKLSNKKFDKIKDLGVPCILKGLRNGVLVPNLMTYVKFNQSGKFF